MKEFNYKRAHAEWAVPEYHKLSPEIRSLFSRVQREGNEWHQNRDTSIDWPTDDIKAAFDAIPSDELIHGMQVIYGLGHWGHAGSDNPTLKDGHGAYWKFETLAKRSLIDRRPYKPWAERDIAKDFMEHKEGSEYSMGELVDLAQPVCRIYTPVEGRAVNYKVQGKVGHPFMIGLGHFQKDSIYLDPNLHGCYWPGEAGKERCGLPYSVHTHDVALIVRGPSPYTEEQRNEIKAIFDACTSKKARIDGIAFIEPTTENEHDR